MKKPITCSPFNILIKRWLKRTKPDCLICGNDRVAFIAYQHLLSQGLSIPRDIGVLGFDNMVGTGGLFFPPLSTVRLPHDEIGKAAAMHIIRSRKGARIYRVPMPFYRPGIFLAHRLNQWEASVGGMPSLIRRCTSLVRSSSRTQASRCGDSTGSTFIHCPRR